MPTVRFSKEDFLAGKVMKPGPYHVIVKGIPTKPAKGDGSDVYHVQMRVVQPGDYLGVPLTDYISEKAQGTAINLVKALENGKEPSPDQNYELANGVGQVIQVQISNSLYNGRVKNEIVDYMPKDPNFQMSE